jgi:branched-chain amino acid transport system permease protein
VPVILLIVLLVSMAITALYWTVSASPTGRCGIFWLVPMLSAIGMSFILTNFSQGARASNRCRSSPALYAA